MCELPRPLKPTTATRRSLFAPLALAWIFAGREIAAAAAAVRLMKDRRVVCIVALGVGSERVSGFELRVSSWAGGSPRGWWLNSARGKTSRTYPKNGNQGPANHTNENEWRKSRMLSQDTA